MVNSRNYRRVLSGSLWGLSIAGAAAAEEPRSFSEPKVLQEPAHFTDVANGFEQTGEVDFRVTLSYASQVRRASLLRETRSAESSSEGLSTRSIGSSKETTNRLNFSAELGLFHDFALRLRLPVILGRTHELSGELSESDQSRALWGAPGSPLFQIPFRSPARGGLEYLAIGLEFGVLDQYRSAGFPTVVVGGEVRMSVAESMRACQDSQPCWLPGDSERQIPEPPAVVPQMENEGSEGMTETQPPVEALGREPGVGRGVTGLELHVRSSQRMGRFEPYLGIGALFEFPNDDSDFPVDRAPPWQGTLVIGVELIPWEAVATFQRLSVDWRLTGVYRSEGLDYSELFDALGSSTSQTYREPNAGPPFTPGVAQAQLPSTGLTEVEAHGSFQFATEAHWRVGRYVRFDLGGELAFTQKHLLTLGGDAIRPETDLPGQRFVLDTARSLSGWVRSTVLF